MTFSTKYPVPISTITVSVVLSFPGTYSELVKGMRTFLSISRVYQGPHGCRSERVGDLYWRI